MSSQLLASKIVVNEEEPQIVAIPGVNTSTLFAQGVTERGPLTPLRCTSYEAWKAAFGGFVAAGKAALAIKGFFENGGADLWFARVVHLTDVENPASKTSAAATVNLLTSALSPSGGTVLGTIVEPFALQPGDTLVVAVDGGGPATATFDAAAASRESAAGNFALSDGQTLTVSIDGGAAQTITFLTASFVSIGAATPAEVVAVINAGLIGGSATVTSGGTKVTITSDRKGTGSGVNVSAGSANTALAFTTGNVAGTGDVSNIQAVTVAEIKTVVEADVSGVTVTNVGGAVRITSNTTGGSSSVQVQASSTADDELGLDNAVHVGSTGAATNTLLVSGKYDGTYAHSLRAVVAAATSGDSDRFNLSITRDGVVVESWANLTMDDSDELFVETVVNGNTGSNLVTVTDLDVGGLTASGADQRPANGTSSFLSGGNDGLVGLADADFVGASSVSGKTGIHVFDTVQGGAMFISPDRATATVQNAIVTYCEVTRAKTILPIFDSPAGLTAAQALAYFESTAQLLGTTEFGAGYWPRIKVLNPSKSVFGSSETVVCPPSGHIAGMFARNDAARIGGVYTTPAGVDNGRLIGAVGLETDEVLEESVRDILFPKRINPIVSEPGVPVYVDGARTFKGTGNFPSIGERRGAIFIEQSIKNGLQFARHRNNTPELRALIERSVEAYLIDQMNVGAFRSKDPATAFFIDFGDALNSAAVQFANRLVGRVGIATNKPAEFIILNFSQDTRALQAELAG